MVLLVILLALAGCGWLFWQSAKLIIHGFKRAFAPSFVPTFGVDGPTLPTPAAVPGWTARMVSDHLATCSTCRESYVAYTLTMLEPVTIDAIIRVIEREDAVVAAPPTKETP